MLQLIAHFGMFLIPDSKEVNTQYTSLHNSPVSTGGAKQENREITANTLLLSIHSVCCKTVTSLQESFMSGRDEDPRWDDRSKRGRGEIVTGYKQ
jgi:hypothetical protein